DDVAFDLRELIEPHFGAGDLDLRAEADLRQAPLQGHLAAFEADLVVAALARALTLHATAAGLALAGGSAASDAESDLLAAGSRRNIVESHSSSTCNKWPDALIMPRTSGVSVSVLLSRMRRRPSPRTVAL